MGHTSAIMGASARSALNQGRTIAAIMACLFLAHAVAMASANRLGAALRTDVTRSDSGQRLDWNGPASCVVAGRPGRHSFRVEFRQANFRARGRKLFWVVYADPEKTNGTQVIGTRSSLRDVPKDNPCEPAFGSRKDPSYFEGVSELDAQDWNAGQRVPYYTAEAWLSHHETEVTSIRIVVDGHTWPVSRSAYRNLLDPDFNDEEVHDAETAALSRDGKSMTVTMAGTDASNSYCIHWRFWRSGRFKITAMEGEP